MTEELIQYLTQEATIAQWHERQSWHNSPWDNSYPVGKKWWGENTQIASSDGLMQAAMATPIVAIKCGRDADAMVNITAHLRNLKTMLHVSWKGQKREQFLSLSCKQYCSADGSPEILDASCAPERIGTISPEIIAKTLSRLGPDAMVITSSDLVERCSHAGVTAFLDIESPRWEVRDGAWQRLPFMVPCNRHNGIFNINESYINAPFEDVIFTAGDAMDFLIQRPQDCGDKTAEQWLAKIICLDENQKPLNPESSGVYFRAIMEYTPLKKEGFRAVALRYRR